MFNLAAPKRNMFSTKHGEEFNFFKRVISDSDVHCNKCPALLRIVADQHYTDIKTQIR